MVKSSFIFNFKNTPKGSLWATVFFILVEVLTRLLWNPNYIGERIYGRFDPSYNYGYDLKEPVFFKKDDKYFCYPTQYINIHKQILNIENDFRIFTFGGSVSRGRKDGNYSYVLENILNSGFPETSFSAINLSAEGFGSSRMLVLLKKVIKYKPDLIIWHIHGSNEYEDERDLKYKNEINKGFNKILFSSHSFVIMKKIYSYLIGFENEVTENVENEIIASRRLENLQKWNLMIDQNLAELIEIVKFYEVPILLIGRVEQNYGKREFETQRVININNVIKKHTGNKIYYFDTPEITMNFSDENLARDIFYTDPYHWSLLGHKFIAEEITKYLFTYNIIETNNH